MRGGDPPPDRALVLRRTFLRTGGDLVGPQAARFSDFSIFFQIFSALGPDLGLTLGLLASRL